jgi:hypothetical protein
MTAERTCSAWSARRAAGAGDRTDDPAIVHIERLNTSDFLSPLKLLEELASR